MFISYHNDAAFQVFQRRQDGSVNFYRRWKYYNKGFGELDGEFWLGKYSTMSRKYCTFPSF